MRGQRCASNLGRKAWLRPHNHRALWLEPGHTRGSDAELLVPTDTALPLLRGLLDALRAVGKVKMPPSAVGQPWRGCVEAMCPVPQDLTPLGASREDRLHLKHGFEGQ